MFLFEIFSFNFNFLISHFYPLNLLLLLFILLLLFRVLFYIILSEKFSDTNQKENIISYEKFV